jgi:hypothetical protein
MSKAEARRDGNYEQSLFLSFTSHWVRSCKLAVTEGERTGFTCHRRDCASGAEAPVSQGRQMRGKATKYATKKITFEESRLREHPDGDESG